MSQPNEAHEPVTVTDKRRIDPVTGEVREGASGPAPSGPAPDAPPADNDESLARSGSDTADALAELTADLQRVQADFANYRKRALRDQQVTADRAKAAVITQLLGVLDDLDRARSHGDLDSGPLKSVADKLTNALQGLGLVAFGDEGDEFDPSLHEAVQHEGSSDQAGSRHILGSVLRRGYRLGEQVLRHAMVGVVDTVEEEPETDDAAGNADAVADETAESESAS